MKEFLKKLLLVIIAIPLFIYGCRTVDGYEVDIDIQDSRNKNFLQKYSGYIPGQNEWGQLPRTDNWGRPFEGEIAIVVQHGSYTDYKHYYEGLTKAYVGGSWKFNPAADLYFYDGGKIVLADDTGQVVTEQAFDELRYFHEELAAVRVGEKWGFIYKTGKYTLKPQFEEVLNFYGGWAAVRLGEKWGFCDKTGKHIIVPQFDGVRYITEDKAMVKVGEEWMYIDKSGNLYPK